MISFIVIGKNEGKTIKLCINSIKNAIAHNKYSDAEIIYVDSKSTDNSLSIVKQYKDIKIFEITGTCNAAIARNIGVIEAKGNILCFLDADMELQKDFLPKVIKSKKLIYPFVSGQLQNIYYNNYKDWKQIDSNYLHKGLNKDTYNVTTGGYFIIDRNLWFSVKGMKTKYRRSQDLDLGLRLAKKRTKLLRKKELMVKHHTIAYQNNQRMWKMIFNGSLIFQTSVLYRDHIFNKYIYKKIIRNDYSLLMLILTIFLMFVNIYYVFIYLLLIIARNILRKNIKGNSSFLSRLFMILLTDITSLIGVFVFFPRKHKLNYKEILNENMSEK